MIKLIAFDLDGTLTQHKTPLDEKNRAVLEELAKKYKLVMAGAGQCRRIYNQMNGFPIDIIGNYGLQYAEYDLALKDIVLKRDLVLPCERKSVEERTKLLREKHGFTEYKGESVEFHPSGCVTIALIGTQADIADKLVFDPDRAKRRGIYKEVCALFPEYTVFVGGSSSFDMVPAPYDKYYALDLYCKEKRYAHDEVVFVGDDYGPGGNDSCVYNSDFGFICTDRPEDLKKVTAHLL